MIENFTAQAQQQKVDAIANSLKDAAALLQELTKTQAADTATPKSEYLTIEQAAEILGMKKNGLYRLTHRREIAYTKPTGKQIYFRLEDLQEWQSRNRQGSRYELESKLAAQQLSRKNRTINN